MGPDQRANWQIYTKESCSALNRFSTNLINRPVTDNIDEPRILHIGLHINNNIPEESRNDET